MFMFVSHNKYSEVTFSQVAKYEEVHPYIADPDDEKKIKNWMRSSKVGDVLEWSCYMLVHFGTHQKL
jgi:hypothetical protein